MCVVVWLCMRICVIVVWILAEALDFTQSEWNPSLSSLHSSMNSLTVHSLFLIELSDELLSLDLIFSVPNGVVWSFSLPLKRWKYFGRRLTSKQTEPKPNQPNEIHSPVNYRPSALKRPINQTRKREQAEHIAIGSLYSLIV